MSTYTAPLKDMRFAIKELAGLSEVSALPGFGEANARAGGRGAGRGRQVRPGSARSAEPRRRQAGRQARRRQGYPAQGVQGGVPQVHRGGMERPRRAARVRRAGLAPSHRDAGPGNLEEREHGAVPGADADVGRVRGAEAPRLAAAAADLPSQADLRRVDRHHEPHRAAGGLGSIRRAHARGARGRPLPHPGHQDLHHLGRARHDGEHRAPGAGAHARCAGRGEGHLAVHRAEVPA